MINHRGLVYFLVLAMFPYHVQMSTDLRAVKAKPAAASVSEVINIAHAQKNFLVSQLAQLQPLLMGRRHCHRDSSNLKSTELRLLPEAVANCGHK